jgi:cytochrome c oxidase assembly protein subunit 15
VVLSRNEIGIFHAALAQAFFVLLCVIAVLTSRWWLRFFAVPDSSGDENGRGLPALRDAVARSRSLVNVGGAQRTARPAFALPWLLTILILVQLVLGATMRHQHAGLAIPDFPLAYGKVWPAMDAGSVQLYNQQRMETVNVNPITGPQIGLQMVHRVLALIIFVGIAASAWRATGRFGAHSAFARWNFVWVGLVLLQASLGAATIWSNKAADVATAHVVVGALLLANGAMLCLILPRSMLADETLRVVASPASPFPGEPLAAGAKS